MYRKWRHNVGCIRPKKKCLQCILNAFCVGVWRNKQTNKDTRWILKRPCLQYWPNCFVKARSEPERNKDLNIVCSLVCSFVCVLSDSSCLQDCQQWAIHLYILLCTNNVHRTFARQYLLHCTLSREACERPWCQTCLGDNYSTKTELLIEVTLSNPANSFSAGRSSCHVSVNLSSLHDTDCQTVHGMWL